MTHMSSLVQSRQVLVSETAIGKCSLTEHILVQLNNLILQTSIPWELGMFRLEDKLMKRLE